MGEEGRTAAGALLAARTVVFRRLLSLWLAGAEERGGYVRNGPQAKRA